MKIDKADTDILRPVVILTKPDDARARGLTPELIREHLADTNMGGFFLSSPEPFMVQVKGILQQLRVGREHVHQERSGGKLAVAEAPAEQPNGIIEFVKSGKSASLPANRSVLETAELNGIDIPYGCRQGRCGICATRLLAGDVRMDCEDGLNPALKAQGYVLTCVGRARGKVCLDA